MQIPSKFFEQSSISKTSLISHLINLFFFSSDFFFAIFKIPFALSIPVIEPLGLTLLEIKNAKSPVPQHKSAQSSPFKGSNKLTNFLFHN